MTLWTVTESGADGTFVVTYGVGGAQVAIAGYPTREAALEWIKDYLLGLQYTAEKARADALLEAGVPERVS